nr:MAG TPA: hypothetical protein [Caudoviricetes sp.]
MASADFLEGLIMYLMLSSSSFNNFSVSFSATP